MASPQRIRNEDVKVQFNTRVTLRMRNSIDDYLDYMDRPMTRRPDETEDWPASIGEIVDEALTTFFADHPKMTRKGPKIPPKPKTQKKPATKTPAKKTTPTTRKK